MDKEVLHKEVAAFLSLPDNWDSYGATHPPAEAVFKAIDMIENDMLPFPDANWTACPGANSVQLEMHSDGYDIEIYIEFNPTKAEER